MSINQGCATSSSFRVKDLAAFMATLARFDSIHPIEVRQIPESDKIYLVATSGFWPDQRYTDDEQSTVEDASLLEAIAPHLVENSFAILQGVSFEHPDELWFTHWTVTDKGEVMLQDCDTIDCLAIARLTQRQYSTKDLVALVGRLVSQLEGFPNQTDADRQPVLEDAHVMLSAYDAGPVGSFPE